MIVQFFLFKRAALSHAAWPSGVSEVDATSAASYSANAVRQITHKTSLGVILSLQRDLFAHSELTLDEKKEAWQSISKFILVGKKGPKKEQWVAILARCSDFSEEKLDLSNLDLRGMKFKRAKLDNINFSKSNLTGANFKHAVVQHCCFDEAKLLSLSTDRVAWVKDSNSITACRVDEKTVEGLYKRGIIDFSRVRLVGKFGAHMFRSLSLVGCSFNGANFSECGGFFSTDLRRTTLTNLVSLNDSAMFRFCKLNSSSLDGSMLNFVLTRTTTSPVEAFVDDLSVLQKVTFSAGSFKGKSLNRNQIYKLYGLGVRDFSGAIFRGSLSDLSFKETVTLKDVTFSKECELDKKSLAYLRRCGMTSFQRVRIIYEDLSKIDLSGCDFSFSVLLHVKFSQNLQNFAFSAAQLDASTIASLNCTQIAASREALLAPDSKEKVPLFDDISIGTKTFLKLVKKYGIRDFAGLGFDLKSVDFSHVKLKGLNLSANQLSLESIDSIRPSYRMPKRVLLMGCLSARSQANMYVPSTSQDYRILTKSCYATDPFLRKEIANLQLNTMINETDRGTWIPLETKALGELMRDWTTQFEKAGSDEDKFKFFAKHHQEFNILRYQCSKSSDEQNQKRRDEFDQLLLENPFIQALTIKGIFGSNFEFDYPVYFYFSENLNAAMVVTEPYFESCFVNPQERKDLEWRSCYCFERICSETGAASESESTIETTSKGENYDYKCSTLEDTKAFQLAVTTIPTLSDAYSSLDVQFPLSEFIKTLFEGDLESKSNPKSQVASPPRYQALFLEAVEIGRASERLVDPEPQMELSQLLNPLLADPQQDNHHLSSKFIERIAELADSRSPKNTARILFSLAWVFARLSSMAVFGTVSSSPQIIRALSIACLNSAKALFPTLISEKECAKWTKFLAQDTCSGGVSDDMFRVISEDSDQRLREIFFDIKPKCWHNSYS